MIVQSGNGRSSADLEIVADAGLEQRARCALWWHETPRLDGKRVGFIGAYSATDSEASRRLLSRACSELLARGCDLAIGPVDGSTWARYRFVVERGSEPHFFLEPDNPDAFPAYFLQAGFDRCAEYVSTLVTDLDVGDPRMPTVERRLANAGVTIRSLRVYDLDGDLARIHRVSARSFAASFLYAPTSESDLAARYAAVLPYVVPDLVLIAEQGDEPVGFVFSIPDLLRARRGEAMNTLVVKTLAVLPGRAYAGLGKLLLERVHRAARMRGMTRAIHALMHETNVSRNLALGDARVIRRYGLFSRSLREPIELEERR